MTRAVQLQAWGLATSLGIGRKANASGMRKAEGQYATIELPQFEPALLAPYLSVAEAPQAARLRFDYLLDQAIMEVLGQAELELDRRHGIPVYIGSSSFGVSLAEEDYQRALEQGDDDPLPMPIDGFGHIAASLRQRYGFSGPDYSLNTACTASANALLAAARAIRLGHCERALVVGLETRNVTSIAGFHGMQLLSHDVMRPFDQRRSGLVLGEGCGAVLLGVGTGAGLQLLGGASRCDNYSISASNPDGSAIADTMQAALDDVGIAASEVLAIKAHGTASPLNDDGEAAGMRRVFAAVPPFCSLKAYIGHTLGSCGVIETAMMAEALQQDYVPASAGFAQVDESLGVAPLREAMAAGEGCYMLNFFGFGGNNSSLIVRRT